jgi:hypothetical protein
MTTRKRMPKQEPLLNAVARKLGHAAGTFTRVTQDLRENMAPLAENVTAKVREAAEIAMPTKPRARKTRARRKISRVSRTHPVKPAAGAGTKRKRMKKSSGRRQNSGTVKK